MRKYFYLLLLGLSVNFAGTAQYVTIPDATFVTWLQNHGYAGCMSGNQLDTTCSAVLNAVSVRCYALPIRNLTGIQYFKNIDTLDCSNDSLTLIPSLPANLTYFNAQYNLLTSVPALPASLRYLDVIDNHLTSLPALPSTLAYLYCDANQLSALPALPSSLIYLYCDSNSLTALPALPSSLSGLRCSYNQITSIPALPSLLSYLICDYNQISALPTLPGYLSTLTCNHNLLTSIPALPPYMDDLSLDSNQVTSLPTLPPLLDILYCTANQLTALPPLPSRLENLDCSNNQITALPDFPPILTTILCSGNQLTSLPVLPARLNNLYCYNNPNLTCLPMIPPIGNLIFYGTAVACMPNYPTIVGYADPSLSTVPLCGIFNPNGCTRYWDISGLTYYDENIDCSFDSVDVGIAFVKTQLYSNGILQQQAYSGDEGLFSFGSVPYGTYSVGIDTSYLPFILSPECQANGYFINDTLSALDSISPNNNFALLCRTQGFDIGVYSILNRYAVPRPGTTFTLYTVAGDISGLYRAHCAAGISGQVQMVFSGQLSYVGPAIGALTPTAVSGDTITWVIADFGTVNDFTAFNVVFNVNSQATPNSSLCFNVSVTPTTGDYNIGNNALSYCFPVVDALDPNEKEVYPSGNTDISDQWLTYTIRFQNTGNAEAVNVRVTDTLSSNVDPSTFQLLNYSAKNVTQLFGNDVVFNFPNINLPDSATSDSASRGYVQYKVKLRDNLPVGTTINNTAYIYFDLNSAVVTNTTTNIIGDSVSGIRDINDAVSVTLYPNPAHNYTTISVSDNLLGSTLQLTDAVGRVISQQPITNTKYRLQTSGLANGVYLVKVLSSSNGETVKKLVIQ